MAEDGVLNYKAIVVPQTINGYSPIGVVSVGDEDYDFYANDTFDLVAGCQYTINATVKKEDEVIIVEVDFDSSVINDWDEGSMPEAVTEASFALADFADMTTYPKVPTWIITDTTASGGGSQANAGEFSDLQDMLDLAYSEGYDVNVVFENLTSLDDYAFYNCSIISVSLPEVLTIGTNAFYQCTKLTDVSAPKATYINNQGFSNCSALATIYLPLVETIGTNIFNTCSSLVTIDLPSLTSFVGSNIFADCTSLESVSLPKIGSFTIGFDNCDALRYITFATESEITAVSTMCLYSYLSTSVTLTTGSINSSYVSGNVLSFGYSSITFKEIIILD